MARLLTTAVIFALTTAPAFAQTTANAPVTATIVTSLSISATGTSAFGAVSDLPHTEILDPIIPGQGKSTAVYSVLSAANRTLTLSCPQGIGLAGPNGALMSFVPRLAMSSGAQTQAQATALSPTACPTSTVTSPGDFKLYLGGVLTVTSALPAGAYAGTFTLGVAY